MSNTVVGILGAACYVGMGALVSKLTHRQLYGTATRIQDIPPRARRRGRAVILSILGCWLGLLLLGIIMACWFGKFGGIICFFAFTPLALMILPGCLEGYGIEEL